MIAFALSFDDLVITSFNAGVGSSTLPLYIYSKIRFGVTPEINAVSTIIVGVTAVAHPHRLAARRVPGRRRHGRSPTRRRRRRPDPSDGRGGDGPAVSAPWPGPRCRAAERGNGTAGTLPSAIRPAPRRVSGRERRSAAGRSAG